MHLTFPKVLWDRADRLACMFTPDEPPSRDDVVSPRITPDPQLPRLSAFATAGEGNNLGQPKSCGAACREADVTDGTGAWYI